MAQEELAKIRDWQKLRQHYNVLSSKSSTRKNIRTPKLLRDSCRHLRIGWEDLYLSLTSANDQPYA